MAREPMRRGPVGERFSINLRELRQALGVEQAELSDRLEVLGHPIGVNSISRLERGERRADVADLVALALALGVTPNRLLLTADADRTGVNLTEDLVVAARDAWAWAAGDRPLPKVEADGSRRVSKAEIRDWGAFNAVNRPHRPPNPTTAQEIYEQHREGLEAVRRAWQQAAEEHDVPVRVIEAAFLVEWTRQDRQTEEGP